MKLFAKIGFNYDYKIIIYNNNLQTIRVLILKADKINIKLLNINVI